MAINRAPRDLGDLVNRIEQRLNKLERRGRGFSIPEVVPGAPTIAADEPPADPGVVGTLWIDTNDGNKIYRWDGSKWTPTMDPSVDIDRNIASTAIVSWQDTAASSDGLVVLYSRSTAPAGAGLSTGDLWVRTTDNMLHRWNGSAWASQSDTELGEILGKASLTSTVADGRVRTWWQNHEPTAEGFGDLWVNTSSQPNTLWRWNNFSWVQVLDWSLLLQQDQLDSKISTYYSDEPPESQAPGDIWYDTSNDNHPYRADGTGATTVGPYGWVSVQDKTIQEAANEAAEANSLASDALTAAQLAQATADGSISTYYQQDAPWPNGSAEHDGDLGDMWYDTDNGKSFWWDTAAKLWQPITDSAIQEALEAAQDAQTTADGKITAFYSPTAPAASVAGSGDLWYDTDDKNKVYYWDGSKWVAVSDKRIDEHTSSISEINTTLADNAVKLTEAKDRIDASAARINDAFTEIDLKPDQAYVDAARQQAIDAAALKAEEEAEAARIAAIADAEGKLAAARAVLNQAIADGDARAIDDAEEAVLAAKAEMAQDAQAKADAAKNAAILQAAQDATNKAAEVMSKATEALDAAQAAQATADNAIRTYYSADPPWPNGSSQPEDVLGDMWYDDDSGQAYRWNGSSWIVIVDQTIGQALAAAQNAQSTADGKISGFYQPTEPLTADEGDLWYDTDDNNKPYARKNGQWVSIADLRIAAQATAIGNIQQDITGLEGTLDGKSNVWVQSAQPTGLGMTDKGDIWINDGASPRTTKVWNGTTWVDADSRITQAVADVAKKITTYYTGTTTAPTGTFVDGDLWIDVNGKVSRWSGSAWVTATDPKALADGVEQRTLSRGTDLVTNGTGYLKNNTNFKSFVADLVDVPTGATASFKAPSTAYLILMADELIPFDPNKSYRFAWQARQTVPGATDRHSGFIVPYDASGWAIAPQNYAYVINTTTTLAKELKPGDTTVTLESAANYYGTSGKPAGTATHLRGLIFWDYVDPQGKAWAVGSYSRNVYLGLWDDGGVNGNVITLRAPWAGPTKAAGTPVSNSTSGGSYVYTPSASAVTVPEQWTKMGGDVFSAGIMAPEAQQFPGTGSATWGQGLPPGTAAIKVGWLMNLAPIPANTIKGITSIAGISFSDAAAAQDMTKALATTVTAVQGDLVRVEGKADGKANIYVQATAPTGMGALDQGDIWIDTSGGKRVTKVWSGTVWQEADTRTAQALSEVSTKIVTYFQPAAPTGTGYTVGDLWVNSTGKIARWSGSAWIDLVDPKKLADDAEANAKSAAQGWVDQVKNTSLTGVTVEYAVGSSETVAPTTGWSSATPTRTPGTFIWFRSTSTRGDGSTVTTNPALLTGPAGAQGIQGPKGADGQPTYTWLKYADTPTSGMSDSPTGKTYMGIAYNKTTATESTTYSDYSWSLIKGADGATGATGATGAPGRGVSSTTVTYQVGTSGTTAPTGTWQSGPQATSPGQFLWTRTFTTYTDGLNPTTTYAVAAHGATGSQGATGNTGAPGRGISSTAVSYQAGSSGTTAPTGTWASAPVPTSPGQYLWTRTITTFTSAPLTETSYSVSAHGSTGAQGVQGPPGADGSPTYTWIKYATTATGTSMSDDPTGRPYIGFAYNKLTATESTVPGDYTWSLIQGPQGDTGPKGDTGAPGAAGRGVGSTTVTYAKSTSGTAAPAAGSFGASIPATTTGEFLWTRTVTTYTDGLNPTTAYSVSAHGATGATGSTGPAGRGVSGTTVEYAKAATGTTAPGSGWASTVPATVAGEFLWTRTTTTYTSGSPTVAYSVAAHGSTGPAGPGGEDGTDGVGITGTTVTYQTGASGTTAPTGAWQSSPTTTSPGQYLWTKTVTTLSDATSATAYAVAAHGATGPQGSAGAAGADGIGITGTTVTYQKSSSGTTAPTGTWVSSPVATTVGEFLWTRTITSYSSGSPTTAYSVAAHGSQGPQGVQGAPAPLVYLTTTAQALVSPAAGGATSPATAQVVGAAVNTTITAWTYSVNGAAFTATVPAGVSRSGNTVTITGSTMTAKTITVRMADAAGVADTATVAKVADGAAGSPGNPGAPGADAYTVVLSNEAHTFAGSTTAALAGSTTSAVIAYKGATRVAATVDTITGQVTGLTTAITSNGTTSASITITATTALTTRNGVLSVPVTVDGQTFTKTIAWAVSYTGATGSTGVSVSSVTPYFRTVAAGTAAPAAPSGSTPAAPWQATEPAYAADLDLYRSDRIVFSNGTTSYTPVTLVSAYTAVKDVASKVLRTMNEWKTEGDDISIVKGAGGGGIPAGTASATVSDASGSNVIKATNTQSWISFPDGKMTYTEDVLYRISARVRRVSGTGSFYLGVEGLAADGATQVNTAGSNSTSSQHYFGATAADPGTSWTTYVGYFRGYGAPNATGIPSLNVAAPGKAHANVRYIWPMAILGYSGSSVNYELDWIKLEALTPDERIDKALDDAKAYATSMTNGTSKSYWSTIPPGTTQAAQDSVWYEYEDYVENSVTKQRIKNVYTQTAAGIGATWKVRSIKSEVIDTLDVGQLSVSGTSTLRDVVAEHIAARSGQYITLDVSQLTVTEDTYLNDVLAEHIASRTGQFLTLDVSDLTVFGNLTSSYPSGRNFTFGEGGLTFVDTDGSILFNAPLDPSQPFTFSGEALLQALTTLGNFSMQGTENELSQSARWTLSNGMSKPGSSAKVNIGWEARSTDIGSDWNRSRRGLIFWKTYIFVSTLYYFPNNGDQIHRMDTAGTDGSKTNLTFVYGGVSRETTQVRTASGGFTVIGDHLYLFGPKYWDSDGAWFVQKMSLSSDGLTATFVAEWEHAVHTTACIGRDGSAAGSNLIIAVNNYTPAGNIGRLSWQKRKSLDFSVVGSLYTNSDRGADKNKKIFYIEELTGDLGGTYVLFNIEGSSWVYAQSASTGAASEARSFRVKSGGGTTGVAWDGTRFWHHVPADAVLNKHSTTTWWGTYSGEKWWASYTWYDGTAPAQETQMATPVSFTMHERMSITFTIPPIPGIATAARRYLGRGATAPTRTGMSLDGSPMTGRVARSYPTRPGTTGVNPPPAASTFTGVSPARIESGAGGLVINGDGTGTWPVVENRVNQGVMDYLAALRPKSGGGGSVTTTSSTSATTISGAGDVSFVAPPSGQVRIDVGMLIRSSAAGSQALGGYQLLTSGGSSVYTTTGMVTNANTEWVKTSNWDIYTGLTPGATYRLRPVFSSSGASSTTASASQTSYTATPIA